MGKKAKRGIGSALGKVGGAIKKGAGAVAGAAKSAGKELGNKVTYNKLMKSLKDAGSPNRFSKCYEYFTRCRTEQRSNYYYW